MKPVFDENGLATVPGDMRCFIMMQKHLSIRAGLMNILILA